MNRYSITKDDAGKRLDKFLTGKLDITRSQIQKLIKNETILVNNKSAVVHKFLKEGDIIITDNKPVTTTNDINTTSQENFVTSSLKKITNIFKPAQHKLNIITETENYLIVNKPAGLLIHEADGTNEITLADQLVKKYPKIKKVGENPIRPGIVHRLDREVSGLIVVAKTQDMFDHLKSQFKERTIKKEYITLVYGTPQKNEDEINFNISRSETKDFKMAAVPEHEERGRKSITGFEVLENIGNYTLLRIMPKTGRTHQIRVHLNAYGLPIVGDLVYKPKKLKTKIKMSRIFLHAQYLGFTDLDGKWVEFTLPLPEKLQNILNNLKKS
ncbi:MAG: RluA family pseudouridine synthase [Candidatus Kerfeldbacteria bacterium]|jgi:23S rRNA pseudouridine1911/1915/1917 synthase